MVIFLGINANISKLKLFINKKGYDIHGIRKQRKKKTSKRF